MPSEREPGQPSLAFDLLSIPFSHSLQSNLKRPRTATDWYEFQHDFWIRDAIPSSPAIGIQEQTEVSLDASLNPISACCHGAKSMREAGWCS